MTEVARLAGVSQTTASFVLSGRGEEMRISPEVEAAVRKAVRDTGYRPNAVSRSLRTGSTRTIAFISDTVATTPYAGHLIWGAIDAARERDRHLLIAETEGDPELERQQVQTMHDRQVDGIVLASMYTRKVRVPDVLRYCPGVLLNAVPAKPLGISSVVPDEVGAGRDAVGVLLNAGHTEDIWLIGVDPATTKGPKDSLAAVERLQGITQAFASAGLQITGGVMCAQWQAKAGYSAVRRLLRLGRTPKAFICFSDRLSVGAYQALQDAGLKVPNDVSIVSFDDDPVASWLRPELTSIALPHYELGRKAIEVLLDGASDEDAGQGVVHRVRMPVHQRDSVKPPA